MTTVEARTWKVTLRNATTGDTDVMYFDNVHYRADAIELAKEHTKLNFSECICTATTNFDKSEIMQKQPVVYPDNQQQNTVIVKTTDNQKEVTTVEEYGDWKIKQAIVKYFTIYILPGMTVSELVKIFQDTDVKIDELRKFVDDTAKVVW
jgi:hypothetical protein